MTSYRRNFIPGGTFFFTVALADRSERLLVENIELLRAAFRSVKQELPFEVTAIVVLPEHLHAIWRLPEGDVDYPTRWKRIKGNFSRSLPRSTSLSSSRIAKGERGTWQRRYWEHTLRDEEDLRRHIDYIHYNPLKHGHVKRVCEWPYSSFHRFVEWGVYPLDWAGGGNGTTGIFGE